MVGYILDYMTKIYLIFSTRIKNGILIAPRARRNPVSNRFSQVFNEFLYIRNTHVKKISHVPINVDSDKEICIFVEIIW